MFRKRRTSAGLRFVFAAAATAFAVAAIADPHYGKLILADSDDAAASQDTFATDTPKLFLQAELVDVASCPQLEGALDGALAAIRAALVGALDGAGEIELLLGGGGAVHVALSGPHVASLRSAAERLVGQAGIAGEGLDEPGE